MNAILLTLIFAVVLGAAIYSRLPLTIVCMTSVVALMTSMKPHSEPFSTILEFVSIPANVLTGLGSAFFGFGAPLSAGLLLLLTLGADLAITNAMSSRR